MAGNFKLGICACDLAVAEVCTAVWCAPCVYGQSYSKLSGNSPESVCSLSVPCVLFCLLTALPCAAEIGGTYIRNTSEKQEIPAAFLTEVCGVCTGSVCQHYAYAIGTNGKAELLY